MIREIGVDMGTALPQRLQTVLEQAGCSVSEIQQRCDGKSKLHGVPLATARLLSEAHRYTWFTIASSDEIHHTHKGEPSWLSFGRRCLQWAEAAPPTGRVACHGLEYACCRMD